MRGKFALLATALFLFFAPAFSFAFRAPDQPAFPEQKSVGAPAGPVEGSQLNGAGLMNQAPAIDLSFRGLNQTIFGDPVQGALSYLAEIKSSWKMNDPYRETRLPVTSV